MEKSHAAIAHVDHHEVSRYSSNASSGAQLAIAKVSDTFTGPSNLLTSLLGEKNDLLARRAKIPSSHWMECSNVKRHHDGRLRSVYVL